MDKIELVRATIKDVDQLQEISSKTFYETFSADNTEENMKQYLETSLSTDRLKAELKNEEAEFYFAIIGNDVIGYLKINLGQAQTELKDQRALEIERIYVLQQFQGKKVGQLLYQKALEVAKQKDADYVWLGVWENNHRAINFYRKNGFTEFDKHIFKLGDDEQTDIMMKLQLKPYRAQVKDS